MTTITYSAARKELAKTIKNVLDNREPITISKKEGKVIMMSLDDWNAWQETFTLLSNPHMAKKLKEGIEEFENKRGIVEKTDKELKSFE